MSRSAILSAMGIEVYHLRPQDEYVQGDATSTEESDPADQHQLSFDRKGDHVAPSMTVKPVAMTNTLAELDLPAMAKVAEKCELCSLSRRRNRVVFGSGSETADLMFIGEGPGAEEDRQGLPFVGKAGKLLTSMIASLGYAREQVYICNIVKCRPPNNRDPSPTEAKICSAYLKRQIELIKPKVIVALGRISAQLLLDTELPLSHLRRQAHKFQATDIDLVATYHPAYLLRKPTEKAKSWEDLWTVRQLLKK